jgi:CRP-like cAMP-binding protein
VRERLSFHDPAPERVDTVIAPASAGEVVEIARGETIVYPGRGRLLYRVIEGLIRLYSLDETGAGMTLRYVKPGGYFGEESLLGLQRRYFAEASTAARLDRVPTQALDTEGIGALNRHLIAVVADLYSAVQRTAGRPLRVRLAAELLELSDSALADVDAHGVTTVVITHDEIATSVGSVRETVTKTVGDLVRSGAIEAGYGRLRLLDPGTLRSIAES